MKIRITENQYGQLVEQSLKDRLKRKALEKLGVSWGKLQDLISRLRKPTEKDFEFLTSLSGTKLRAVLKLVPGKGFIKINCNNGDSVGYCHLRVVNDNLIGLKVPKGFPIGVSGGGKDENLSGNSMGAHLHYITWKGNKKVNPITVISGGYSIPAGGKENRSGKFCDPTAK